MGWTASVENASLGETHNLHNCQLWLIVKIQFQVYDDENTKVS